jgi:hypothetical protein
MRELTESESIYRFWALVEDTVVHFVRVGSDCSPVSDQVTIRTGTLLEPTNRKLYWNLTHLGGDLVELSDEHFAKCVAVESNSQTIRRNLESVERKLDAIINHFNIQL